MSINMPADTSAAIGADAAKCESRSLYLDRFSDPGAKDSGDEHPRRDWFNSLRGKRALSVASDSRSEWLTQTTATGKGDLLFAQLQSRLMVNMAGGVMENAGLCLDRFGLPYIPGSAVKGCARRAGLAALHEWCDTGSKPVGADNLFTPACAPFQSPAEMLASIARVFGWSEQDWKSRSDFRNDDEWTKKRSDFAWACGDAEWGSARQQRPLSKHFAGNVSFASAHPVNLSKVDGLLMVVPSLGQLELDVVTCHHGQYYASKDPNKKATDTEVPLPVVFPTIAPGHVFAFALFPLGDCTTELLKHARTWLATGLSTSGLGAKTAAGYGWFDTSQSTHQEIVKSLEKLKLDRKLAEAKAQKDAADKSEQEEIARRRRDLAEKLAQLSPELQEDAKVEALTDDQFRSAVDNYAKRIPEEQKAIARAMRLESGVPSSRRASWDDLKAKAQKKGGKYAQTEQAIRQLSKQMFPGKEGKMP